MSERVSALFAVPEDAERAAAALIDHGVDREAISMVARGPIRVESDEPAEATSVTVTSPADVATGAAVGAGVGAALGLVGTMLFIIPGVGPIMAAGAIAAALAAGAGVSAAAGAVAGGVYGALRDLGVSEGPARVYETSILTGSTLVSVRTEALLTADIQEIFEKYGAAELTTGLLPDADPNNPRILDEELATVTRTEAASRESIIERAVLAETVR
jgi:hypothetical protein